MSSVVFEIIFILALIIANGVFSGSEIAVVSARKIRLEQLAKKGDRKAKLALKLANSPNDFLSTVQIGITLIGILSGALGGATVAQRLEGFLKTVPLLAPYSQPLSILVVVGLITYLSLVLGELTPKRLALNNPEQIACAVAGPMRMLSKITAPVVKLLSFSTGTLVKLLGVKDSEEPPVTEAEIRGLIEQGTEAGMFEEAEQDIVNRVFRLGDRPIRALMTPRRDIIWLDVESTLEENKQEVIDSTYSRFPVARGSLDNCLGVVRVRNLLSAYLIGEEINLEAMLQAPLYVPESTKALKVLELFKESGTHIAMVTDEYGDIAGLVTLNDLVEGIVGELPSAEDSDEPMSVQREDGSWLLDGLFSVDELKHLLDQESFPDEETAGYHTLGGLVMTFLGRIPHAGDHFEYSGVRFEVMDMDGARVDKVLVSKMPTDEENFEDDLGG